MLERLQHQKNTGLHRQRYFLAEPSQYLSFSGNNYLGLAQHPEVIAASKQALDKYGLGSSASSLLSGYSHELHALEEELAEFLGYKKVLVFATGYMANIGLITTLCNTKDHVFLDRLSHASLIDGCRQAQVRLERYRHNDITDLQSRLAKSSAHNKIIGCDGLFSMDGDLSLLPEIAALAKNTSSLLVVDDAHGIGVLGKQGRGILEHFNLTTQDVPILVGTLSKAFGVLGGFIASNEIIHEGLIQFARSYGYTTALPIALAQASRASLRLIKQEAWRRVHLNNLIRKFQELAQQLELPILASKTPIQLLVLDSVAKAQRLTLELKEHNIIVDLIRPPTVPKNTARLRISLTANHTFEQIEQFLMTLKNLWVQII